MRIDEEHILGKVIRINGWTMEKGQRLSEGKMEGRVPTRLE